MLARAYARRHGITDFSGNAYRAQTNIEIQSRTEVTDFRAVGIKAGFRKLKGWFIEFRRRIQPAAIRGGLLAIREQIYKRVGHGDWYSELKRHVARALTIVCNVWLVIYVLAGLIYVLAATTARPWVSSIKSTDPRQLKRLGAKVLTIGCSAWLVIYVLLMIDAFLYPKVW
jgi:hypothetical protein